MPEPIYLILETIPISSLFRENVLPENKTSLTLVMFSRLSN